MPPPWFGPKLKFEVQLPKAVEDAIKATPFTIRDGNAKLVEILTRIDAKQAVQTEKLTAALTALTQILELVQDIVWAVAPPVQVVGGSITFEGLAPSQEDPSMYIVADVQTPVRYNITPPTQVDARGRPVPQGAHLNYSIVADPAPDMSSGSPVGPGIVVTPDDPANPGAGGTVGPFNDNEDGTPATCNINVVVSLDDGTMVGSFGAQFTITAGPVTALVGGSITFEGLTEAQQARR